VVETHVSLLVLTGSRVYKARKPVRYGFVDFTTRAAREADCHQEVALNRPYAPGVYLGVYDVVAEGVPVDHVVVLRRLPASRRLSRLVTDGRALPADLRAIVARVCEVDRSAARSPEIDRLARADALLGGWRTNGREMAPFVGDLVDARRDRRIHELAAAYLEGRTVLLEERIAAGRVRDGHGDLRAEDVYCLEDGVRILDCVEFDANLRALDIAGDLAFLAMDLEHLGDLHLAVALQDLYAERSGDRAPGSLWWHYAAAHAYVRAKVACLSAVAGRPGARAEARELHGLAERLLDRARVRLVLVGGPPGAGKSTLASALAASLEAEVLHSDEVRKGLASRGELPSGDPYSAEATAATYDALVELARRLLSRGRSVVLDASWHDAARRRLARAAAQATASEAVELACTVPPGLGEERVAARRHEEATSSDATVVVARALRLAADPWPEATPVDTSGPRWMSLEHARQALGLSA
jgi:hypothetical protein